MLSRCSKLMRTNYGTLRGWVRSLLGHWAYVAGRLEPHLTPASLSVSRLVFVCLGNINRSAFAAEVARTLGVDVCSIGLATSTGAPASETAVSTAHRFGMDLSSHTATDISDYSYQTGDLLLTMEVRHITQLLGHGIPAHAIAPLGHWGAPRRIHLHDPATLSDDYFRTCFALIHCAVINLTAELRASGSPCAT